MSADGTSSRVDIGGLHVTGGETESSIALDGALGIQATLAGLEDVFEAANGAVIAAREAADDARRAAADAQKTAESAQADADATRKAAEEAAQNAGL